MPTLAEVGEVEAIRRLVAARPALGVSRATGVVIDAGDDAAVWSPTPGHDLVATTDAFVEGRHYDPQWLPADAIGARLAAANLSDLAAMAASPRWALLSIGARPTDELDDWIAIERGLSEALARDGAILCGGNLAASPGPRWMNLTLVGEAPRGRIWTRSGARPGDLLSVTGSPGRAAAGLLLARALGAGARDPEWTTLLGAWLRPRARCRLALALAAAGGVTAAIDLSDGFAGDLARLADASRVGAEVEDPGFPVDADLERAASVLGRTTDSLRLGPSDDYELLLAIDPARFEALAAIAHDHGASLGALGRFTGHAGTLTRKDAGGAARPLAGSGFDHFGTTKA